MNVSFPVTGAVTSPITFLVTEEESRGAELITNGGFDADADWTKGANAVISGGKLNISTAVTDVTTQNISAVVGQYYEIIYEISGYTSGAIRCRVGSSDVGSSDVSVNGRSSQRVICGGDGIVYISVASAFVGSIDNISVRKV